MERSSKKVLRLGIPKGSLEKSTIELFERSGWRIRVEPRSYFPYIDDDEIQCSLVRAQEMSRLVEDGTLDAGITGKDWIEENNSDVVRVADLVYSKLTKRPARWVLVVKADSPISSVYDLQGKKIYTELVGFTKRYLKERGIEAEVEFSWGATEAKVVMGLCDAIVEVTETGSTIRANNLRIVEELMVTYPQLIANKGSWKDEWKRKKIEDIALLLKGALKAEGLVVLKMNVEEKNLEAVVSLLPSITSPTVSPLYGGGWYSVETVCSESEARKLIPELTRKGAVGIIEYSLNKVI